MTDQEDQDQVKSIVNSTLVAWENGLDLPYHIQLSAASSLLLTLIMDNSPNQREKTFEDMMKIMYKAFLALKLLEKQPEDRTVN